ncbi:hypothetical protein BZG36_05099 [Bifiguratus adelaidae]|uniref:Uncharacterized protein n=1 Tax=Bifiguratus adelaidae TaxID=1938954 RepID=A0A261XU76_9FUNG|nr:hypothetical protein BZG36_05099 [Bifiguratus adelaidae]
MVRYEPDVDLSGKTVIVTGANIGIGLEVARYFAKNKAHVVLACHNEKKAKDAIADIKSTTGSDNLEFRELDQSSFASVRAFAEKWTADNKGKIDILVDNAGVLGRGKRYLTDDGFEEMLQVNHLGPFLLTNLLAPHFINNSGSRVVNTSSRAAKWGKLDYDNINYEKSHADGQGYCNSKLYNVLFTKALAKRLDAVQSPTVTQVLHPGFVTTNIGANSTPLTKMVIAILRPLFSINSVEGAQTTIHCAVSKETGDKKLNGSYWDDSRIGKVNKLADDAEKVDKFWDWSVNAVGLKPEDVIGSSAQTTVAA